MLHIDNPSVINISSVPNNEEIMSRLMNYNKFMNLSQELCKISIN